MNRRRVRPADVERALHALRAADPIRESDVDTPERRERSRALFERIVATPRHPPARRPVRRWSVAVAGAAAAVVLGVGAVLSLPPRASAAELLERAATATSTYQEIPIGREAYQRTTTTTRHQAGGFRYRVETTVETRVSPDGSATTTTSVGPPRFDGGDEQRWVRAGRPPLPGTGGGGTSSGPVVYRVGGAQLDYGAVRALPADPSTLSGHLRRIAPEQGVFESARQLIVAPGVPGELRAALYRVLAGVPGVELAEDSASRVVVRYQGDQVAFDPRSGELLAASGPGADVVIRSAGLVNCVDVGVRPASLTLACADANYAVDDLRWLGWGGQQAAADGVAVVNSCTPSCAEGSMRSYPVHVVLDRPRACGLNLTAYTRARVHYVADVPEGLDRDDVQDLPCGPG